METKIVESKKCKNCKKTNVPLFTCSRCKKVHLCVPCDTTSDLLRWVEPEEGKEEYICAKCVMKHKLQDWDA